MQTKTAEKSPFTIPFPNISPINTAEEATKQGHYDDYYRFISNETVKIEPAKVPKNLHLVCFDRAIGETEYVELLRTEGKRPCQNAPQYLLGLMAAVPEDKMPKELRNKYLVAAEPDNRSSAFTVECGCRCFLFVYRYGGDRKLCLAYVVSRRWNDRWAFLAEDLVP